jgi:hypothetical protein
LHHQGDVGVASYAAVVEFVPIMRQFDQPDWNGFALAAVVEESRLNGANPNVPEWLAAQYTAAWGDLRNIALERFELANSIPLINSLLAVLAFAKQRPAIGTFALLTDDERAEALDSEELD